ncbi:MAG TPA: preprotein translocase subunit YajC [Spirochaetota bacterium]|nr:preprotein translocase subunit YajC [Spirochaetota bacterium]
MRGIKVFPFEEIAYASNGQQSSSPWVSIIPLVLMIVIFYLLLIRPQQKKEKDRMKMINQLKKGNKVLTSSGMIGVIVNIKPEENIITLKLAEGVKVDFVKSAIQQKLS